MHIPQTSAMRQQIHLQMIASEQTFTITEAPLLELPIQITVVQLLPMATIEASPTPEAMVEAAQINPVHAPNVLPLPSGDLFDWLKAAGWPDRLLDEAVRVVSCESNGHPSSYRTDSDVWGLFQLWSGWWTYYGLNWEEWSDPVANARLARWVYTYDIERGQPEWNQWQCKP